MADTGLQDVRDVKYHILRLPFSHESGFGTGLEQKLKERKDLNNQLLDLLPEADRKRKLPPSSATTGSYWKKPRFKKFDKSMYQFKEQIVQEAILLHHTKSTRPLQ
jgi:hypothetical protein